MKIEEKRGIAENLAEEELTIFNLLFKEDLIKKEKEQIKNATKKLSKILKEGKKLVLDWRKKQQTLASVRVAIEIELDELLPNSYPKRLYSQKCD